MPNIQTELVDKLSSIQPGLWQTTSSTVSEAANQAIALTSPLTIATRVGDLYSEMSAPMMIVQFAFASQPENLQVVLIPQEVVTDLVELIQGAAVDEIDENTVSDVRGPLEAIVQGLCLGVGAAKSEMVVASGLTIRFQIFAFPHNLQIADFVIRTQVALSGEDLHGSITWLMDPETAAYVTGYDLPSDGHNPFPVMGAESAARGGPQQRGTPGDDGYSLDLLLDVPLEVSVELGRVKMIVRDVLDLGNGSILEIDKAAGEPVDVLVNGRLMARGEVVVIEDNFGVRITEIINPNERFMRHSEVA